MKPVKRLRSAGAKWRILVHEPHGRAHDVSSDPKAPEKDAKVQESLLKINPKAKPLPEDLRTQHVVLEGTEFDELVVGHWIHLEQMDTGYWWMNVAGVTINIRADRDGKPKSVAVYGPGDYDDAKPGVKYYLTWGGKEETSDEDPR